jgi:hypothetical protein
MDAILIFAIFEIFSPDFSQLGSVRNSGRERLEGYANLYLENEKLDFVKWKEISHTQQPLRGGRFFATAPLPIFNERVRCNHIQTSFRTGSSRMGKILNPKKLPTSITQDPDSDLASRKLVGMTICNTPVDNRGE